MQNPLPLTDNDGEVRELSEEDYTNAVPFSTLPDSLQTTLLSMKGRGKQQAPTKISTTVRFDREVLDAFHATGQGWQTCMNDALKEWLENIPLNMAGEVNPTSRA